MSYSDGGVDLGRSPVRYVEVPFLNYMRRVQGLRLYRVVDDDSMLVHERIDPCAPKLDSTTAAIIHIAAEHGIDLTDVLLEDIEDWPSQPSCPIQEKTK